MTPCKGPHLSLECGSGHDDDGEASEPAMEPGSREYSHWHRVDYLKDQDEKRCPMTAGKNHSW